MTTALQSPNRSLPRKRASGKNGFILALFGAVALAFLFPGPGARGGWLHPDLLNNIGVALILFLQGLSMAVERMRSGAGNWRLHLIIQSFTFVIFPLIGLLFHEVSLRIWPNEPSALRDGFLYLCVLPSTVSTSVVLTNVARGNTAAAIFNAGLSNILGVFLTPLLVRLLMQAGGQTAAFAPLLIKITLLTLVPFLIGMAIRPLIRSWIDANTRSINTLCNGVILFIVYTAFCDSVEGKLWQHYGFGIVAKALAAVIILFSTASLLVWAASKITKLSREDFIAALFCSVKKTLAMGVPLAHLIFGAKANLGLILLPIMFYHPLQLFICGLLAGHFSHQAATIQPSNRTFSPQFES
jgi:solute carrier family 10 (sodium/bile acid cotransporter), member 7